MADITKPPKVFISYAWEDDIKTWTRELATRLRFNGVEVILDQWYVAPGDSLPEFMENSVSASDFVLVVCTPAYKNKSDSSDPSGVGYEKGVITGELFVKRNQRKFIPVLRKGKWLESAPSWVLGKNYIDLRGNPLDEDNYQELLRTLYGKREPPPPLGTPPDFSGKDDGKTKPKPLVPRKPFISKDTIAKFTSNLKNIFTKLMPVFRLAGVLVVISVVLLAGSWAIPKFISLIPTPKTTATTTQRPVVPITFTNSPIIPTKTTKPISTPTKTRTPAPTALSAKLTDDKGVQMVLVKAGDFMMGSDGQYDTQPSDQPVHQVYLDNYYIDVYEVTNALYKKCVDSGSCKLPRIPKNGANYYNNPDDLNFPVVYVDWYMATDFCKWRDARLPTEAEWEKTASRSYSVMPWDNKLRAVGTASNSPMGEIDISTYGVYDTMYNITEWVSSLLKPYPYSSTDGREDLSASGVRVQRGGNFTKTPYPYDVFPTSRYSNSPTSVDYKVGFRCARSMTP